MKRKMAGKFSNFQKSSQLDKSDASDTPETTLPEPTQPETTQTDAASPFSGEALSELLYVLEEEKLAGDVYEAFADLYGQKIFDRIAAAEDQHFDAVLKQAENAGVDTDAFVFEPAGSFVDPELQELYDSLIAYGSTSVTAALEVGIMIEEKDIVDLKAAAEAVPDTPLETMYENLLAGSYSHLDAFEAVLG